MVQRVQRRGAAASIRPLWVDRGGAQMRVRLVRQSASTARVQSYKHLRGSGQQEREQYRQGERQEVGAAESLGLELWWARNVRARSTDPFRRPSTRPGSALVVTSGAERQARFA